MTVTLSILRNIWIIITKQNNHFKHEGWIYPHISTHYLDKSFEVFFLNTIWSCFWLLIFIFIHLFVFFQNHNLNQFICKLVYFGYPTPNHHLHLFPYSRSHFLAQAIMAFVHTSRWLALVTPWVSTYVVCGTTTRVWIAHFLLLTLSHEYHHQLTEYYFLKDFHVLISRT